ncbi:hypothetical protein PTH_2146 [Pelotomaculum thermopropionicum SI]|uniref:RNA polymerase sigma-70 region 4 domain-containing protein n=1 Tax=Pelotomaculum thermopropionicum (strain DSM 13744 / JCM 10971 / SI) TaxID=370438 RepID=A5D0A2_PELTS|nr:hypothetical protein PTH_2146 [Pelotomaculum thermopropionicum SI]
MLIDFADSMEEANLTRRQKQVIYLVFGKDLPQKEVARLLNISQQAVSDHVNTVVNKIAQVNRLKGGW